MLELQSVDLDHIANRPNRKPTRRCPQRISFSGAVYSASESILHQPCSSPCRLFYDLRVTDSRHPSFPATDIRAKHNVCRGHSVDPGRFEGPGHLDHQSELCQVTDSEPPFSNKAKFIHSAKTSRVEPWAFVESASTHSQPAPLNSANPAPFPSAVTLFASTLKPR